MSQDLARQHGTSRLQTTSADLKTILINITASLRIYFPLLNRTELCYYRLTDIVLLPIINF
jgi:hypothetical protein